MSLQTGTKLAVTAKAIVDPATLTVTAYEVVGPLLSENPSYLRTNDVREVGGIGMIVDSQDEFVGHDDVIRLKNLIETNYVVEGKVVKDQHGRRLGKVADVTIETGGFVIQQLHIKRGLVKGITDTGLLIHRAQIVEVNNQEIIVKGAGKKETVRPVSQPRHYEYVNPFRSATPQPDSSSD